MPRTLWGRGVGDAHDLTLLVMPAQGDFDHTATMANFLVLTGMAVAEMSYDDDQFEVHDMVLLLQF